MTGDKVLYLLAGTGIGAALGLLFAPKSGQEIRDTISNKFQESDFAERASSTVRNVMEKGKNIANISKQRFNESVESGKQTLNEAVESGTQRLNESIEAGKSEFARMKPEERISH